MKKSITLMCFVTALLPLTVATVAAQKPRARDQKQLKLLWKQYYKAKM